MDNAKENAVPADLLAKAQQVPAGAQLESFDPMENVPTIGIGKGLEVDKKICGFYEETQMAASLKFTKSKTHNEKGVPTLPLHILRIGSPTGDRLGIWGTAELKAAFEKTAPGTLVTITYKGKGKNGSNNDQHFFDFERGHVAQ